MTEVRLMGRGCYVVGIHVNPPQRSLKLSRLTATECEEAD